MFLLACHLAFRLLLGSKSNLVVTLVLAKAPLATYPSTSHSLLFAIACAQKFRGVFPVSIIGGLLGKARKDEKIDISQLPKLAP
ncbi:hypothetical protein LWI28_011408 [Acer negundo]|uniref:Uncharacterized protein n=1 Tax=Acer negundo TaxID=4023 RepID=A0AAD5JD80_ACENE|nr:hypothetical protein LWI28_011408 [Acer negundo]